LLATVSRRDERAVKLTSVLTGHEFYEAVHKAPVRFVAFSHDHSRLVTLAISARGDGRRELTVWDARTGQQQSAVSFASSRAAAAAALSPDGAVVVHSEPGKPPKDRQGLLDRLVFRDAASGDTRSELDGIQGQVLRLAYSPDGRHLAVAAAGVTVY